MEVFPAAVGLIIRSLIVSARWGGRARRLALEQATAATDANREAALEARVVVLEDMVEQRDAHIEVLESRLGRERSRKPYPLMERLRIIWLMQYFDIPGRRLKEMLGVSRSSVRRWLKGFEEGKLGKGNEPKEPVNKTPREMAELIWDIFRQNPLWGRWRIAMVLWGLGVFVAASTVRNVLLRPRPEASAPAAAQAQEPAKPRQIIARYPNHVWSVDRTRVWRWHIWPTWAFVAVDHFSRMVTAVCPLEGPNAGWVVEALEGAFLRHGPPNITPLGGMIITNRQGLVALCNVGRSRVSTSVSCGRHSSVRESNMSMDVWPAYPTWHRVTNQSNALNPRHRMHQGSPNGVILSTSSATKKASS